MAVHRKGINSGRELTVMAPCSREKNQGTKDSLAWALPMLAWLSLAVGTKHLWAHPEPHTREKISGVTGDGGESCERLMGAWLQSLCQSGSDGSWGGTCSGQSTELVQKAAPETLLPHSSRPWSGSG